MTWDFHRFAHNVGSKIYFSISGISISIEIRIGSRSMSSDLTTQRGKDMKYPSKSFVVQKDWPLIALI